PDPSTPHIYTLSLHDALPILGRANRASVRSSCLCPIPYHCSFQCDCGVSHEQVSPPHQSRRDKRVPRVLGPLATEGSPYRWARRSEEHTSELQSRENLVCRLL